MPILSSPNAPAADCTAPHKGRPLKFPESYRDARNRICELQAGTGYGMFRYEASPEFKREVYNLEMEIINVSEPLGMRSKPLSSIHKAAMRRIYELMQVPGFNGRNKN